MSTTGTTGSPTATMGRELSGAQSGASSRGVLEWIVPAIFVAILLGQLLCSVRRLSQTSDEADHLHAGYRYWQCADFGFNPEHPPLSKLVAALPLRFIQVNDPFPDACDKPRTKDIDFEVARQFLYSNPNFQELLFSTRAASSIFSIGLLICLWVAARRIFGFEVAVIASALLVFEPNILAHGALVTSDVALTFAMLFAVYAFYRFTQRRTLPYAVLCGLATGVALASKHSAVLLAPMLFVLAIADALLDKDLLDNGASDRLRRAGANLAVVAACFLMAVVMLWGIYGFRYSARPSGAAMWDQATTLHPTGFVPNVAVPAMMKMHLLPESYLNGLREVTAESEVGRQTFILGHLYPRGQWFYFPLNFLIKCTVPFLLLLTIGVLAWRFWAERKKELAFLAIPPAIYLLVSMRSGLNMGIRHVLPVLPFLILLAAAGAWAVARRVRWGSYGLALLLVLHAASSLHAFPDYICYGNELWGGPAKVNDYLTDSNSDWGQQLLEARDYLAKHPGEPCWAVFRYHVDIRDWGVPCNDLQHALYRSDRMESLPRKLSGLFLVSGRDLSGDSPLEKGFDWGRPFVGKTPIDRIGGSAMYVFRGEFDMTIPAGMKEMLIERALLRQGDVNHALEAAQKAVALVPESGMAHAGYCAVLQSLGEVQRATAECQLALTLLRRNPEWNRESIDDIQNLMASAGMPVAGDAAQR